MNVGDTVTVRIHGGLDCEAKVVDVYADDVLDVQIGALRPLYNVQRSDDPKPFTWRS